MLIFHLPVERHWAHHALATTGASCFSSAQDNCGALVEIESEGIV